MEMARLIHKNKWIPVLIKSYMLPMLAFFFPLFAAAHLSVSLLTLYHWSETTPSRSYVWQITVNYYKPIKTTQLLLNWICFGLLKDGYNVGMLIIPLFIISCRLFLAIHGFCLSLQYKWNSNSNLLSILNWQLKLWGEEAWQPSPHHV